MEIYAPLAERIGMDAVKTEFAEPRLRASWRRRAFDTIQGPLETSCVGKEPTIIEGRAGGTGTRLQRGLACPSVEVTGREEDALIRSGKR